MQGGGGRDVDVEIQQAMNAALWVSLIYLHLMIGLVAGLVLLWRVKTKRRWWGALLAYVCLVLIVAFPFIGRVESSSRLCWSDDDSPQMTCSEVDLP